MSIAKQSSDRPRRLRDRAAREHALITAAGKLFASRGYEATTTRGIAFQARCAEGLIHRYFGGKSGLLTALIQSRVARDLKRMNTRLTPARRLDEEILHLVAFEVNRVWGDRDFFKVFIPCAICHPAIGRVARSIGPKRRAEAIAERLKSFADHRGHPQQEIEAIAHFVEVVAFMFGFLHPVVLGQDRGDARKVALSITKVFVRGFLSRGGN
jgi:TetR/AcrR family transcriptional regulator, regulator of cefoperazone and chloramphenicol sensitivity